MSERLVEEGWLAPARPGPRRVQAAIVAVLAVLTLAGWFVSTMTWRADRGSGPKVVRLEVNEVGRAARTDTRQDVPTEVRTSRDVDFLVVQATASGDASASGARDVQVTLPAGVDGDRATLRVVGSSDKVTMHRDELSVPSATVELGGAEEDLQILLLLPASAVRLPADKRASVGPLSKVTRPLDRAARTDEAQLRTLSDLRDKAPWMVPLLFALSVGAPLLLWRRARRAFFSMRRPGPGKDLDSAPPSSLDPVGAAVLVAGARPVDAAASFAGHVLDLVERRQLLMKRTMSVDPGAGALIGLGHAEEFGDDAAILALRAAALDDGMTVALTDSRAKLRRVPEPEQDAWHLHVAARQRFEGIVDRAQTRRLVIIAGALAIVAIGAFLAGLLTDALGTRALLWLAAAVALPAAAAIGLWARDAATWRIVTRARRLERAQWIAWRGVVGTPEGPALDQRNIPVIAATGDSAAGIRTFAGPDAVALDAVTVKTIERLKSMIADE
ncbi:MAG: hypothetical protein JWL76_1387 [Thermoleophilia bacterium]|nr:hypothetical protein [Thermoleophilia bacterium]